MIPLIISRGFFIANDEKNTHENSTNDLLALESSRCKTRTLHDASRRAANGGVFVQVERRVFVNNIIVRFHPELELDGDEVKTIICRYPSPKVVLPPAPAAPVM